MGQPSASEIMQVVIEELADVRDCCPQEIFSQIKESEDVPVSSTELLPIIAEVEDRFGCSEIDINIFSTERTRAKGASALGCLDPAEDTTLDRIIKVVQLHLPLT